MLLMNNKTDIMPKLFNLRLVTQIPAVLVVFTAFAIFNAQQLILRQKHVFALCAVFIIAFMAICFVARVVSERLLSLVKVEYPTVMLWLYPTLALTMVWVSTAIFMSFSNRVLGRGFWNIWLGLTGQDTTTFFFTCFGSMLIYIAIQFGYSVFVFLTWLPQITKVRIEQAEICALKLGNGPDISSTLSKIKTQTEEIGVLRARATKLNRLALLVVFLSAVVGTCWLLSFRPALVLYYRAEIQLRTFLEPMAAYKTLEHLLKKYPDYRFRDSVTYRMAWILDRRLQEHHRATKKYEEFLTRFGNNNIWADEAITSLVRLSLDKLNDPEKALHWTKRYLEYFPAGIMAPHMHIYQIRALVKTGKIHEARELKKNAESKYQNSKIRIVNSEDRLVGMVPFTDALANIAPNLLH